MNKAEIEAAIHSHIRGGNSQDDTAMATHFTEPAMFILASDTRASTTRPEFVYFLRGVFQALNAAGFDHTEFGAFQAWRCA